MDMFKMLGQMKEVQKKLKEAQENLGEITATGDAGAGMVTATVNGKRELLSVAVDDSLLTPNDKEMLQDLVVAAVNKALREVEEKAQDQLQQSTGNLFNIPGFDPSQFT
ncbi:MAG TPA: DNA-binding protein [Cytophagales bacterium]|nr:DNA-binding protein [Cytophagales bacterium]HAA17298.1 DNA-binding protein [Cytophagales bacterium]HAP62960.1 DNA-binding protein [Cytophagales bacterium]